MFGGGTHTKKKEGISQVEIHCKEKEKLMGLFFSSFPPFFYYYVGWKEMGGGAYNGIQDRENGETVA